MSAPVNLHFLMMHLRDELRAEAEAFEAEFPDKRFPYARSSLALERGRDKALIAWATAKEGANAAH